MISQDAICQVFVLDLETSHSFVLSSLYHDAEEEEELRRRLGVGKAHEEGLKAR